MNRYLLYSFAGLLATMTMDNCTKMAAIDHIIPWKTYLYT